jgi:D-alanine-D-alanine ligase
VSDRKIRVALLAGGRSAEREVSLNSGEQVFRALDKDRYHITRYDPRDDLKRLARDASEIDVAMIILHGRFGEDGTIQGLLDSLDIPYQGSGVLGSAVAMNKIVSKQLYIQAGLPVAPFLVVDRSEPGESRGMIKEMGLPVVIKPEHEGSSIGLSIVRDEGRIEKALEEAWQFDSRCLVERFIKGTEVTGGVLGNDNIEALPLVEIIPGEGHDFFDYRAKYTPGASSEICPARLSPEATSKAREFAKRAHRALCCRGYSRTDMIVTEDNIYVLETNTIPGMTATSLFPQAAAAAGLSFSALLDRLIELAMEAKPARSEVCP